MATENMMNQAKEIYGKLIQTLENIGWHYREAGDLSVNYTVTGDDLPMEFIVTIDADLLAIRFASILPVKFSEEKRLDGIIAACAASNGLKEGVFSCRESDGTMLFISASPFIDCEVGEGWFRTMMDFAHGTVDQFNDKFLMLSKGLIDINKFVAEA